MSLRLSIFSLNAFKTALVAMSASFWAATRTYQTSQIKEPAPADLPSWMVSFPLGSLQEWLLAGLSRVAWVT